MRVFIGIPLDTKVRSELEATVTRIKPRLPNWRWAQPDVWHITLQFLGNVTADQLQQLTPRLHAIHARSFPIQLGGLDLFDRPGVFFAGVIVSDPLLALRQKVVHATNPSGFVPEARSFHPHITLARARGRADGRDFKDLRTVFANPLDFPAFAAREFLLYESFLESAAARYEIRDRFLLTD